MQAKIEVDTSLQYRMHISIFNVREIIGFLYEGKSTFITYLRFNEWF